MECCCRVVHGVVDCIALPFRFTMDLADALVRKIFRHGISAQGDNQFGTEQFYLAVEPFAASLNFAWQWVSVSWGTAFDDIGNVDLFTF